MRLSIDLQIEKPKWWYRIFSCQHEVVSVTENFQSRYGTKTMYLYCLKCGLEGGDISNKCKHKVNCFGTCNYCLARIEKEDCTHEWCQEPDTDDFYCSNCGCWKDEE